MKRPISTLTDAGLLARYKEARWAEAACAFAFNAVDASVPGRAVTTGMLPEMASIKLDLANRTAACARRVDRLLAEVKRRGLPDRW